MDKIENKNKIGLRTSLYFYEAELYYTTNCFEYAVLNNDIERTCDYT